MEIRDLVYLDASAITGNFTRAAQSLGINSSTISRRVGRFEDELGLALFERGHAGIRLTAGGKAVLPHIRRALAELDAIKHAGNRNGNGIVGEVRLAVRMPPVGEPLRDLLVRWRTRHPEVTLTISELNECEIRTAIQERRIDVALMTRHTLWPDASSAPLYRERVLAAIPCGHLLLNQETLDWECLRREILLVQGWDTSQSAREFYASLMGCSGHFQAHAASKQCVLALVGAGFGITLVTQSQAEVSFPGVAYRPIREENAWVQVELVWSPDAEDPAVGRFFAFMRDEARSRRLF
ncbi:MAG: LysR family transcriptional regulator [Alphaproteobacteria bacterium]|nr:LysR family transcriptional regulator [Alphaproteobacteria bacterium]